jgi:hypothetical protein
MSRGYTTTTTTTTTTTRRAMKRQEPSTGATQLPPKLACLRASSEEAQAQAWQLRDAAVAQLREEWQASHLREQAQQLRDAAKAQACQLRELSDAVQRCTTLLTDLSDIIAQYARAASPHVRTTIVVDCSNRYGDNDSLHKQQSICSPLESDTMGSLFNHFLSKLAYSKPYDGSNCNLNNERIMPDELCFEYRNSTVYLRPQTWAERNESVRDLDDQQRERLKLEERSSTLYSYYWLKADYFLQNGENAYSDDDSSDDDTHVELMME